VAAAPKSDSLISQIKKAEEQKKPEPATATKRSRDDDSSDSSDSDSEKEAKKVKKGKKEEKKEDTINEETVSFKIGKSVKAVLSKVWAAQRRTIHWEYTLIPAHVTARGNYFGRVPETCCEESPKEVPKGY
jgi:sorbitol-specific phosphotransferase system component IIBC